VAAGHVMLLADRENFIDRRGNRRMLVLPRIAQILLQITFTDQHDADAFDLFQHPR
jgi:hypothetical protein